MKTTYIYLVIIEERLLNVVNDFKQYLRAEIIVFDNNSTDSREKY